MIIVYLKIFELKKKRKEMEGEKKKVFLPKGILYKAAILSHSDFEFVQIAEI